MNFSPNPKTTYLITGAAGFIGSHLSETLLQQGFQVYGLDDFSTGSPKSIEHLLSHPNFHFARANIKDETVLDRLASTSNIIVHLAAAVGVQLIVERPVYTIETNIGGTEAVLQAGLRYGCTVMIASTSEVYGKGLKVPFAEDDDVLLGTTDKSRWAYAASKMVDEFLAMAYHREYGLPVVPFRLFNCVGPRQTGQYGMVVPRFVRSALRGETIEVYGDGTQSRCFCDVSDVIRGIVGLSRAEQAIGKLFNIGSQEEVSILQLAQLVKEMTGSESRIEHLAYEKAYSPGFEDMQRRVPSIERISKCIGWRPQLDIRATLQRVIDFERGQMERV